MDAPGKNPFAERACEGAGVAGVLEAGFDDIQATDVDRTADDPDQRDHGSGSNCKGVAPYVAAQARQKIQISPFPRDR